MNRLLLPSFLLWAASAQGQWVLQDSHTTASLRGIQAVSRDVAWASGTEGTVLRTLDGGKNWRRCAVPLDAEKLDFRGVQAFDEKTAIVMSSGKGDLSRLYKTTDGCATWKLLFANPYGPEGFFDALLFLDRQHGLVFGDPTGQTPFMPSTEYPGNFRIRVSPDAGETWNPISAPDTAGPGHGLHAEAHESAFAASNTSVAYTDGRLWFTTSHSRVSTRAIQEANDMALEFLFKPAACAGAIDPVSGSCGQPWIDFHDSYAPIRHETSTSGIFGIAFRDALRGVTVGGDYALPNEATSTAANTADGGKTWVAAGQMPHGYRSAVGYAQRSKAWVTVGPNGTDISTDDGKNWRPLRPGAGEAPDADKNWNALSLPFVVGPKGRIGVLREGVLGSAR